MVWRQVKKPESNACPITYLWFQTIFIPLISWKTVRNQKFPLSQNPDTLLCCVWYKVRWPHHLKMPCHKWYVLRNNWGTLSSKATTQTGIMESESIWMQETTHAHKKCAQERRRRTEATGTLRWRATQQIFQLPACQAYQRKMHNSIPKGRQFRVFASLSPQSLNLFGILQFPWPGNLQWMCCAPWESQQICGVFLLFSTEVSLPRFSVQLWHYPHTCSLHLECRLQEQRDQYLWLSHHNAKSDLLPTLIQMMMMMMMIYRCQKQNSQ